MKNFVWVVLLFAGCDYDIPMLPDCNFVGCPNCEAGLKCDPVLGCVQCSRNADCGGADRPVCFEGKCVECTPAQAGACGVSGRCQNNQCDEECSVAAECTNDAECADGTCSECMNDSDCAQRQNKPVCNKDARVCRECVDDGDCAKPNGETRRCSPVGACVDCLVSEDCPQPGKCQADNTCTVACCEDADCLNNPAGNVCDQTNGTCGP